MTIARRKYEFHSLPHPAKAPRPPQNSAECHQPPFFSSAAAGGASALALLADAAVSLAAASVVACCLALSERSRRWCMGPPFVALREMSGTTRTRRAAALPPLVEAVRAAVQNMVQLKQLVVGWMARGLLVAL